MIRSIAAISLGFALLCTGLYQLYLHASAIDEVQEVSAPLLSEIPQLEQRLSLLKRQAELTEFHASLATGSPEEYVHVYLLPEETNIANTLALWEQLHTVLQKQEQARGEPSIIIGDTHEHGLSVHVNMQLQRPGLQQVMMLLKLAGMRTVGDLLSEQEKTMLLHRSEEESPTGIVPLQKFFSTDLMHYSIDPASYQQRLLRSFSGDLFHETFRSVVTAPSIQEVQALLQGPIGQLLHSGEFWPLQFSTIETAHLTRLEPQWYQMELKLVYHQKSNSAL